MMRRLLSQYKAFALLAFNTFVAFIAINALLFVAFAIYDRTKGDPEPEKLRRVYPELSASDIHQLLRETRTRPFSFDTFTHYKERPFQGRFVNVHDAGFRLSGADTPQPWPPSATNLNVFVFGGSTTFGYGVSDAETIPARLGSHLAHKLPNAVCTYNFGRGTYASTQERILFEKLLLASTVPDVAVFIDGVNDFVRRDGLPDMSANLKEAFERPTATRILSELPIGRLQRAMGKRHWPIGAEQTGGWAPDDKQPLKEVVARYLGNKQMIEAVARSYHVSTAFVWQPTPIYKYDDDHYHLFKNEGYGSSAIMREGYAEMAPHLKETGERERVCWLADIQESRKEPLYVDRMHYTAPFSAEIGQLIGDFLLTHGLAKKRDLAHAPQ
jgi:hypothetical protein